MCRGWGVHQAVALRMHLWGQQLITRDTSYSLQYLLSPSYSVGAFGAEAADFINCAKQDAESHPGRAAASCLSVLRTMGRQSPRLVTLSGPKVWPWKLMEI